MRTIAAMLPGQKRATLTHAKDAPLKVLFLRFERIGDMIMATSIIRVLATSSPGISLDVVSAPNTRSVLDNNPHVRKVFTLDRGSWHNYRTLGRQLAAERYDVIVDGRLNNPPIFTSTPLLMWRAGARLRVGVGGGNNDLIYNVRAKIYDRRTHYIRGSQALAEPFGVDPLALDWRPEIFLTGVERDSANAVWRRAEARVASAAGTAGTGRGSEIRFLVNLSASEQKRRWSDEHFIEVLRTVRDVHPALPVVVMGLPAQWDSVRRVAESIGAEAAPTPALRDALAIVGTSDRVLTPDTSISHAASAFNKPVVVLLRRDCDPYAPWDVPGELVFWDGDTVDGLKTETVVPAVLRLLGTNGGNRSMLHDAPAIASMIPTHSSSAEATPPNPR
jgi:ADP-heptose:LPS heptosyltransferase